MLSAINNEPFAKSKHRRTFSEHAIMHWDPWERPSELCPKPWTPQLWPAARGWRWCCAFYYICWPRLIQLQSCSPRGCSCMVLCGILQTHCLTGNALPDCLGDATLCGACMSHIPILEGVAYFSFKRSIASLSSGCLGTTTASLKAMVGPF